MTEIVPEFLLSIRKGSAEAILVGSKPHEFRRKFENYGRLAKVYLYVTAPHKMIVGHVLFGEPIERTPNELMQLLAENKYDTEEKLKRYLVNSRTAFALPVLSVVRYSKPLGLGRIREEIPGFQPPMSYLRLSIKHGKLKDLIEQHEGSS